MAQTVEFRLNLSVDGKEHVISTTDNVKQLTKELGLANVSGDKLRDSLLKFNNISTAFQNAAQGLQQLTGTLLGLTDAYATQQVTSVSTSMEIESGRYCQFILPQHTDFVYQICILQPWHNDFVYKICISQSWHTDFVNQICML